MKEVVVSRVLPAPPAEAFAACTDLEGAADRIRSITKLEVLGGAPVGAGTRFRETRVMFGREATEEMEITDWAPPKGYAVEADSHGSHYRTVFSFEPEGEDATRVTLRFAAEPRTLLAKLFTFLMPGMTKTVEKCLVEDLEDIAASLRGPAAVESESQGA